MHCLVLPDDISQISALARWKRKYLEKHRTAAQSVETVPKRLNALSVQHLILEVELLHRLHSAVGAELAAARAQLEGFVAARTASARCVAAEEQAIAAWFAEELASPTPAAPHYKTAGWNAGEKAAGGTVT